jgi:nucleoside phosphorylase
MPRNATYSEESVNAKANAQATLCDNGYLRLYDGAQPADPNVAVTTQVLLAELRFAATAFTGAAGGIASANALTSDASANATGTATWFRAFKTDGTSPIFDGTVGTAGSDINLSTTSIVAGVSVNITAFSITEKKVGP